ncbi:hypothetical protein ACMD2_20401 [Ananas comosus]|uniref:Serine-rich protein-like protein n=1 Tax=Ananas comosus TaxID=4615 RepID=A0A199VCB2_ANACO|nr:hypothetical protein ACMD2_20401 [Ananas comosus]
MASSSRRSSGPVLPISSAFQRSISPSGRFSSSAAAATTAFASSSSSSFSARSPASFFHRSASPTRVNLVPSPSSPTSSVRFSLSHHHNHHHHRSTSPGRSFSVSDQIPSRRPVPGGGGSSGGAAPGRRTCMCSPTTHPGSFRCSLHKGFHSGSPHHRSSSPHAAASSPSNRLNARRSAMTNSLVRIGTVEGDLVKRALAALIRPSSHHQRRRSAFQPRPSRLSVMSKAGDPDL